MKLLVIGSRGFIGSHLASYFSREGFEVYGCDLDRFEAAPYMYFRMEKGVTSWASVLSMHQYDYCINAAGNGNVPFSVQHPTEDFRSNVQDTAEILDAIRQHCPDCRYLHISSAAVYGNQLSLPVSEEARCNPLSPYGWHKWMAEMLCREYVSIYGLFISIVRPFSIYGPGLRKQLFWDTYQKYRDGNGTIDMWGTGKESRDFIHISDVVKAFHLLLRKAPMKGECYNLASGSETNIEDAVAMLCGNFSMKAEIRFNGMVREGDPLNWRADIDKIRLLGFRQEIGLEEGLRGLAAWLESGAS